MSDIKLNIPAGGLQMASIPVLGEVLNAKKNGATIPGVYYVKELAIVNRHYTVKCPKCGKRLLVIAEKAEPFLIKCEACKVRIKIKGTEAAPEKDGNEPTGKWRIRRNNSNGKLVWQGLLTKKKYVLREGENYIGRKEPGVHSDLTLKDEYASARSVCISVKYSEEEGYSFHLTVLKATNPVLVCGKEYEEGHSVDLNYGDTIVLGNTTLTFKPVKK